MLKKNESNSLREELNKIKPLKINKIKDKYRKRSKSGNYEYSKVKNFMLYDFEKDKKIKQFDIIESQISRLKEKNNNSGISISDENKDKQIESENDNDNIDCNISFKKKPRSKSLPKRNFNKEKLKKIDKNYKLNLEDDESNNSNNNIFNKKRNKSKEDVHKNNNSNKHKKSVSLSNRQIKKISSENIIKKANLDINLNTSLFEEIINPNEVKNSIKTKIKYFCSNVMKLMKQKVYIFCVLAVAVFNFISTAIQYWVSDHLSKVMKFEENEIFLSFVITCVSAPALGVISGGYFVQKFGGYEQKKSILICLFLSILASIDGIFIYIPDKILDFSIVLWIYLFFGGAIIPNLIGNFIFFIIYVKLYKFFNFF